MSSTHIAAISTKPTPHVVSGDENAVPGNDGITRSNGMWSPASPPPMRRCATPRQSSNVHGHPWVSTSGTASGRVLRKWT
jgi:hypothetical protein